MALELTILNTESVTRRTKLEAGKVEWGRVVEVSARCPGTFRDRVHVSARGREDTPTPERFPGTKKVPEHKGPPVVVVVVSYGTYFPSVSCEEMC